jgi:hypothetical protein
MSTNSKEYNTSYYQKNKETIRKRHNDYDRGWCRSYPERTLYSSAKNRAGRTNLEFNITLEDIVIPSHCPILNIPLSKGKGQKHDGSPSLDRIDNTRGYIKGNVKVISSRANQIKSDGTAEEHIRIAEYITKYKPLILDAG